MVGGGGSLLLWLLGAHQVSRQPANGGLNVDGTIILALVVAAVLVVYLTAALLKPEIFS